MKWQRQQCTRTHAAGLRKLQFGRLVFSLSLHLIKAAAREMRAADCAMGVCLANRGARSSLYANRDTRERHSHHIKLGCLRADGYYAFGAAERVACHSGADF
jgi:hypothetical protein